MTRADRLTLVRQHRAEGLSQRQIAQRLGISKDTVRRDFRRIDAEGAPDDAPPTELPTAVAPQASVGDAEVGAPEGAPPGEPVAQLPRRVADPLAGMDVSQWRALRRDLAILAQTGSTAESLVHQAVVAMAHAYRQALARGDIEPRVPFLVSEVRLTPLRHRATAAAPVEGA
ncbi:helix-turn-helix domain-containing protein [Streptomyces sp. NBC_00663]|uniref:HTH domain-containing protein n=1 Tax=Streptomyces sp. NBC_00663 TaxID=2975801 RepID=UPI002E2F2304|nr:HTH domain-containing protein [Streptomyces sp. NBC_00663]